MLSTVRQIKIAVVLSAVVLTGIHAVADDSEQAPALAPAPMPIPFGQRASHFAESQWDAGVVWVTRAAGARLGPQGYWQPGGYEGRIGSPYYYNAPAYDGPLATSGVGRGLGRVEAYSHGYRGAYGGVPGYPAPVVGDVYGVHFGPGFYRHSEYGHYRFPYYMYRAPWYFPGHPVYNRDTNYPW